jgi:heme oxygenase
LDSEGELTTEVSVSRISVTRSTIDHLRARTAARHHGLESGLQVQDRLSQAETRDRLIAGYLAFYGEVEAALRPHLWDMPDLAFSSRVRSREILSQTESPRPRQLWINSAFPEIGTKAEALGALYVLEGSTLGGRKIMQALTSQGVSTDDLYFLNPYGKDTGARWRSFLKILERETASSETTVNACISGAVKAFDFAAMCLRAESTN